MGLMFLVIFFLRIFDGTIFLYTRNQLKGNLHLCIYLCIVPTFKYRYTYNYILFFVQSRMLGKALIDKPNSAK